MVCALITILRASSPSDREAAILDRALRLLDERHEGVPVLRDLIQLVEDAPDDLRQVAMDRNDLARYKDVTEDLLVSLRGLLGQRPSRPDVFQSRRRRSMRRDCPVVFDVSSIDDGDLALQGAALMACWSYGFGLCDNAHALADAGLEPRRHYFADS